MSIVLNPTQRAIIIEFYYVEEDNKYGGFPRIVCFETEKEIQEWQAKGYKTEEEIDELFRKNKFSGVETPGQTNKSPPSLDNNKIIHKVKTGWVKPSWKEINTIYAQSMKNVSLPNGSTRSEIDPIQFRDIKLKTCLKKWNVKDEKGDELPVTSANIDNMLPEIADKLLSLFEKYTELSGDDSKN